MLHPRYPLRKCSRELRAHENRLKSPDVHPKFEIGRLGSGHWIWARTLGLVVTVEVHLFAAARSAVGYPTVTTSGATLGDVVNSLISAHPAFAQVAPRCSYLVDGLAAHGDLALVHLAAGARVDVLPPFAGG